MQRVWVAGGVLVLLLHEEVQKEGKMDWRVVGEVKKLCKLILAGL